MPTVRTFKLKDKIPLKEKNITKRPIQRHRLVEMIKELMIQNATTSPSDDEKKEIEEIIRCIVRLNV